MPTRHTLILPLLVGLCSCTLLRAQPEAATRPAVQGAPSKIVAITVYQTSALVTREVVTPAGTGTFELVVSPLPASTVESSLYSEGTDGLRILTTRYRTWLMQENVAEEVRKLEVQAKDIEKENQSIQQQIVSAQQNVQLMAKLEEFTSGALKQLTEKGMLNAEAVTKLAEFIMANRGARGQEIVVLQQKISAGREKINYLQQQISRLSAGSDKTVREAVIVVDKPAAGPGRVRLNYLVSSASWRPHYKLRADNDKPEVQVEYLAAIQQQSGEDWTGVDLVLSTAQPMLNATPPELAMLDVSIASPQPGGKAAPGDVSINKSLSLQRSWAANRREQARYQQEGQTMMNAGNVADAQQRFNAAAAVQQADEWVNTDDASKLQADAPLQEGQSVTFHLERKHTVPWRDDEQIIEVARMTLKPQYFYKAVPVLTSHIYRLATLTNDSKLVILPGQATMYIGTDFVGRGQLPLVAIGEEFTTGFGVDPQLQVTRTLVDKSRTVAGGNQVHKFEYRLTINSYKTQAVKMQIWDRLPHSETEQVGIVLLQTTPELSKDAGYLRDQRPKNLLRWDMQVEPGTNGPKAATITYQFKMEFDKGAVIGNFLTR